MEFYRNRRKSFNLILTYSGILFVMILIFLYSIGIINDEVSTKGIAISSIFILILGFLVIKMLLALKDTSPLLILELEGIVSKVTPMSKAAGLILWDDIADMNINKVGGDTLITLTIKRPDHYIPAIRKKISALMLKGAHDAEGNLLLHLSAAELDIEAPELFNKIVAFRADLARQ